MIIIVLLIILVSLYHGIVIRKFKISSDKLPSDTNIEIVHLTDLHNYLYGKNQSNLLNKITDLDPDVILMTGDFFDTPDYYDNSALFMKEAVKIAPCYYVTGNHEYWTYDVADIESYVTSFGVRILSCESTVVDIDGVELEIFGVDDPDAVNYLDFYEHSSWNEMLSATYNAKKTDSYSILLSHRPEKVEDYKKYDYDLILSGHSHGGQVRIPFIINGLYAPNQAGCLSMPAVNMNIIIQPTLLTVDCIKTSDFRGYLTHRKSYLLSWKAVLPLDIQQYYTCDYSNYAYDFGNCYCFI